MNMKKLQELQQYVSDKNLPDKEVELFWYGWKTAIENSLKKTKISETFSYQLDLQKTSDILNNYQENKDFNCIVFTIQLNIIKHISICIENYIDLYHARIILSHIKRWKKIKNTIPDITNIKDIPNKFIYLELYIIIQKDTKICDSLKIIMIDHLIFDDILKLLKIAISNKKANIIDKISEFYDIHHYINSTYLTNFYPRTKASKILKMIRDKI